MVRHARYADAVGMSSSTTLAFICSAGCPEVVAAIWIMALGFAAVAGVLFYLVLVAIRKRLS
jgi:hypothetical protein